MFFLFFWLLVAARRAIGADECGAVPRATEPGSVELEPTSGRIVFNAPFDVPFVDVFRVKNVGDEAVLVEFRRVDDDGASHLELDDDVRQPTILAARQSIDIRIGFNEFVFDETMQEKSIIELTWWSISDESRNIDRLKEVCGAFFEQKNATKTLKAFYNF